MNRTVARPTAHRLWGARFVALALCVALVARAAADDKPTRVELGKKGKAATALVLSGDQSGSAFCVHPSGLYVTNEHIARAAKDKPIKLVLDATLKTQRVIEAHVVRTDAARDLALLRAEGVKGAAVLPIGSSDGVAELAELIAFGFPFGTALSADKNEYPAISVNVCTVSALRNKGGELDRIELNGAVNPGQSGGPVLDAAGNVVGVVTSGIRGSGISQAIPSAHVAKFLERPDVEFAAPKLDVAAAAKPVTFRARVSALLPAEKPFEVELTLTGDGPPRRAKMELKDGAYEATLVPVPAPKGPRPLDLTARFPNGTVIVSPVADRDVKVDGHVVALRDVVRVRPSSGTLLRFDGTTLTGRVTGLDEVEVRIGDRAVALDLSKAESVEVTRPAEPTHFEATVAVAVGGKEVGRTSSLVALGGASAPAPAGGPAAVRPPALDADKVTKKLPSAFADVALGGNGRYLIFHLPQQRKLAVFDVSAAKIAGYVAADDDAVKFAAGRDKLVVGLPGKGVLQRWDLGTLERELTVQAGPGTIRHVVMGHASAGPVLVHTTNNPGARGAKTEFLDLKALKPIELRDAGGRNDIGVETDGYVRASADGRTFAFWRINTSPQGVSTLVIRGDEVRRHYDHHSTGHLIPSPDGSVIYTARGRYSPACKALDDPRTGHNYNNYQLPAVHGDYYFGVKREDTKTTVNVHRAGDSRPITRADVFDGLPDPNDWGRELVGVDKRLYLLPDAKVIVTLPKSNDEVVLHKFDIDDALEKSGVDYLFVSSAPPETAKPGTEFRYRVTARAKKGGITYKLDDGPAGMRIAADGTVTWSVPARPEVKDVSVVVAVRDAGGQETLHTFTLKLE